MARRWTRWPLALVVAVAISSAVQAEPEAPSASPAPAPAAQASASGAAPTVQLAPPLKCRIGKPSYCGKHGGTRCLKKNSQPDTETACAAWTDACIECHYQIPECFGSVRPLADSPKCADCEQQWRDCMGRIDARYWPNRRSPSD